jgi:hypothetical protein
MKKKNTEPQLFILDLRMSMNDSQVQRINCEEEIKYLIDLRQRFRQVEQHILFEMIFLILSFSI